MKNVIIVNMRSLDRCFAAFLAATAWCAPASAQPSQGIHDPVRTLPSWSDRSGRVAFERLGATVDRAGRPATRMRLHDARGRTFHGVVTADAVVQLREGVDPDAAFGALGLSAVRVLFAATRTWLVRDATATLDGADLAARLADDARAPRLLAAAVPDLATERAVSQMRVPPDDPRYGGQWYLARMQIETAWRVQTGDRATAVAVVDNGCEASHPDLQANMASGRDALDEDDDPTFEPMVRGNNHGTACAGIVAGVGDNGVGIAGVCPRCTLRCVRLLGPRGTLIPISADVEAFAWSHREGVAVVSNSWGFVEAMPVPGPLAAAMEAVFDSGRGGRGALVVFAAGNDNREIGDDEIFGVRGVITVGAVTNFDEATSFSNRGLPVDISAPTGTVTTDLTGDEGDNATDYTALFGGTSAACPVVSGVAALLLSQRPEMTARDLHDLLIRTARPAPFARRDARGHDVHYGYGIVDPVAAMRELTPPATADAGTVTDALDAGTTAGLDAGSPPPPPRGDGGCSCRAAAATSSSRRTAAAVVLLALATRRRPRHQKTGRVGARVRPPL